MYFVYEDLKLYYEKYGKHKKSIIILPGWGNTRNTFNYMISFLQNFFTVYVVDYPGFGNSPIPSHDLTIYEYSNLIHEWILSLKLDDPILIGHSFGGRIITVLTGYYQYKYNDIIMINAAGIKPKKTIIQKIRSFIYKLLKKVSIILPKRYKKKFQEYLFVHFASSDYKDLNINMRQTFKNIVNEDLKPYLKYIKAKVLLIWGNKDDATPIRDGNTMNRLISNSELVVLDGLGHFTYLENPQLVNQIIYEQLKEKQ